MYAMNQVLKPGKHTEPGRKTPGSTVLRSYNMPVKQEKVKPIVRGWEKS
jgi:hypothetical protein